MSRDQRVRDNHALLLAQHKAIDLQLPLYVVFNLLPSVGVRAREHYEFMMTGLHEVATDLQKLGIAFVMTSGNARDSLPKLFKNIQPAHIYFDFNPMHGVRVMQKALADSVEISCTVVDTHNIIPAHVVSDKQEFAAHTIRRKVHKNLARFLVEPDELVNHPYSAETNTDSFSFDEADKLIAKVASCGIRTDYIPGEKAAHDHLTTFIKGNLADYATDRNNIAVEGQSGLSPYLHFGQLSSLRVALDAMYETNEEPLLLREARMASAGDVPTSADGMNALLEEMVVRKELSDNYCLHTDDPVKLTSAPAWAQK
jgi:deoxyribodipyrimidine photo-lyase